MDSTEHLDTFLLTGNGDKGALVAALLARKTDREGTAPYYRALEALGVRTPDEAFLALRIAIAGQRPDDTNVLALRDIIAEARRMRSDALAAEDTRRRFYDALKP